MSKMFPPIIEPIKDIPSFRNLLSVASEKQFPLNIIVNPKVGEFSDHAVIEQLIENNNMYRSTIMDHDTKNVNSDVKLLFYSDPQKISFYDKSVVQVVPDSSTFRNKIALATKKDNAVIFADCFKKQERNADYVNIPVEDFSEYHLIYKSKGYIGFGDYSIIGDTYNNSGFAPYAVAIHIVYFDNASLKIRHFVSHSNDDAKDQGNKVHEALEQFVKWYDEENIKGTLNDSFALHQLEKLYKADKNKGLGFLKRLEIMHHFELMNRYLSNN
ncbi:hypothetical protein FC35_GL000020 [Limosilactobacillus coleohominis DSM 14060]|nr:hypothetical protein FC35_GL000020 [Limosilactobacillus coleohominis DSM 14060]